MKYLILIVSATTLAACTTTETFGPDGKRTSRTSAPSPETWTTIGNAVATFGATAVTQWTKQIAEQQQWEKGSK